MSTGKERGIKTIISDKKLRKRPENAVTTIKKLLKYFAHNKKLLICLVFLFPFGPISNIVSAWFIRPLINDYIIPMDMAGLARALLVIAFIYALGIGATYLQNRVLIRISLSATYKMREDLFKKMQTLPISFFDKHQHGDLMSRYINDIDQVQWAIESSVVQVAAAILSFAGAVFMMLTLSPLMFIVTAVFIFLQVYVSGKLSGRAGELFKKQQKNLGDMNGYIEEMIEGLPEVKAFGFETEAKKEFAVLSGEYRDSAARAAYLSGIVMPITNNLSQVNYAVTACLGGLMAVSGNFGFDVGSLGSYLQYTRQTGHPIQHITSQLNTVLAALAGAERIFSVMEDMPEADEGTVTLERENGGWRWHIKTAAGTEVRPYNGHVTLDRVSFAYQNGITVLSDISLSAARGQKIALVGSTGAGKTTISSLLMRFYDAYEGSIRYDGIDARDIKKSSLRSSISMVLQDTRLFEGTIMENIRFGRLAATDEECIAAARMAHAHSFIRRLPDGYQTMLTSDGGNLSQGQRQLLSIARAACADAPILILDEATSSVDTRTERHIEKGMDELMRGRTVFVIAHRLSTVRNADSIIVIENGGIIEQGNHDQLLRKQGRYWQLCSGQRQLA